MGTRESVVAAQHAAMQEKARLTRNPEATPEQIADNDIRLQTMRAVNTAITAKETSGKSRRDLSEDEVIAVLRSLVKRRRDTAQEYESLGKSDRAAREYAEAVVIERHLPALLSEEDHRDLVKGVIAETGAEGPRGIGLVMKALKGQTGLDPAVASKIAKELLS